MRCHENIQHGEDYSLFIKGKVLSEINIRSDMRRITTTQVEFDLPYASGEQFVGREAINS